MPRPGGSWPLPCPASLTLFCWWEGLCCCHGTWSQAGPLQLGGRGGWMEAGLGHSLCLPHRYPCTLLTNTNAHVTHANTASHTLINMPTELGRKGDRNILGDVPAAPQVPIPLASQAAAPS